MVFISKNNHISAEFIIQCKYCFNQKRLWRNINLHIGFANAVAFQSLVGYVDEDWGSCECHHIDMLEENIPNFPIFRFLEIDSNEGESFQSNYFCSKDYSLSPPASCPHWNERLNDSTTAIVNALSMMPSHSPHFHFHFAIILDCI